MGDLREEQVEIPVVVDVADRRVEGVAVGAEGRLVIAIESGIGLGALLEPVGMASV